MPGHTCEETRGTDANFGIKGRLAFTDPDQHLSEDAGNAPMAMQLERDSVQNDMHGQIARLPQVL